MQNVFQLKKLNRIFIYKHDNQPEPHNITHPMMSSHTSKSYYITCVLSIPWLAKEYCHTNVYTFMISLVFIFVASSLNLFISCTMVRYCMLSIPYWISLFFEVCFSIIISLLPLECGMHLPISTYHGNKGMGIKASYLDIVYGVWCLVLKARGGLDCRVKWKI